jgi:hypothetical protein
VRGIKTTTISILALGLLAGSAVGVAAQDRSSGYFTGSIDESTFTELERTYEAGPPDTLRGFGFRDAIVETDDERVSGTWSKVWDFDWSGPEPEIVQAGVSLWSIENDGGAWSGHGTDFGYTENWQLADENDPSTWGPSAEFVVLTGAGDYEGMTAMMTVEQSDVGVISVSGVVFEGELPPVPEMMPTAESTAAE